MIMNYSLLKVFLILLHLSSFNSFGNISYRLILLTRLENFPSKARGIHTQGSAIMLILWSRIRLLVYIRNFVKKNKQKKNRRLPRHRSFGGPETWYTDYTSHIKYGLLSVFQRERAGSAPSRRPTPCLPWSRRPTCAPWAGYRRCSSRIRHSAVRIPVQVTVRIKCGRQHLEYQTLVYK